MPCLLDAREPHQDGRGHIYIDSLGGLLGLDVEFMVMSNSFDPPGKDVLRGDEAGR